MEFNNSKVALVTGASSGIGHATAIALQAAGFYVVATAPNLQDLEDLKQRNIETLELDVTDPVSSQNAVWQAESHNGAIQVLVNNAGYGQYGPIEEIPIEAVRNQFETNVFGLLRMCQLVLPQMRAKGEGKIINLSSVAGEIKQPGSGIYHATKHAVEAIDGALRNEVRTFNIQVIGILPGPVNTNFDEIAVSTIPDTGPDSPYHIFKQNLAKSTKEMLKPGGTGVLEPEDVAKTIVEAATTENPKDRYHVGLISKAFAAAYHLTPDKIWDAAVSSMIPVDEIK
ncbi:MAG: SDR family NAD(P)-dependent oxidoreductase [Pyrinomonadaceae bacterium]|nr:SDR family NAD(P)-dependent oxidoreductase [Pyrinomonadaceae bacterium]